MVSKKNSGSCYGGGRSSEARKTSPCFKKRKACILKKTTEISMLCDLEACAIVFSPDGEVETRPENHDAVLKTIQRCQEWFLNNEKKMGSLDDDLKITAMPLNYQELGFDDALADGLSLCDFMNDFVALEDFRQEYRGGQDEKQGMNFHSWEQLIQTVDTELQAVTNRIGHHQQNIIQTPSFQLEEALEDSIGSPNYCSWFDNNPAISSHSEALIEEFNLAVHSRHPSWSEIGSIFSEIVTTEEEIISTPKLYSFDQDGFNCFWFNGNFEDGLNSWLNGDLSCCAQEASEGIENPVSLEETQTEQDDMIEMLEAEGFGELWGRGGGLMA